MKESSSSILSMSLLRNPRVFNYSYKNFIYDIWLYLIYFSDVSEHKIISGYTCCLLINFPLNGHCQSHQKSTRWLFKNWFYPNGYAHKYTSRIYVSLWKGRIALGMNYCLEEAQSSLLSCAREASYPSDRFH